MRYILTLAIILAIILACIASCEEVSVTPEEAAALVKMRKEKSFAQDNELRRKRIDSIQNYFEIVYKLETRRATLNLLSIDVSPKDLEAINTIDNTQRPVETIKRELEAEITKLTKEKDAAEDLIINNATPAPKSKVALEPFNLEEQKTPNKSPDDHDRKTKQWRARITNAETLLRNLTNHPPPPTGRRSQIGGTIVTQDNSDEVTAYEAQIERAKKEIDFCRKELEKLQQLP